MIPTVLISQLENPWSEAQMGLNGLLGNISSFLTIIFILGAIVTLALGIAQMLQGDKDSGKRLLLWFIGFVIGTVFLNILFRTS